MRYSRGPGKGGSCSGSEERNRGRNGVERRQTIVCCFAVMGVLYVAQPLWTTRTISPELSTPHIGRRRCTSRRCRPRARRVCVGSRRPSADVPTCRPRRSREGTRTRETCWNLVPRPPRTGVLPRNRRRRGRAQDAALRRRRDDRRDLFPRAARGDGDTARRRLDAHPRPGDRKVRARFPPEAPFSDFPTRNNGARRVESSPNVFPDPLRSRLPRSPPLTSSPIPSHQAVLLQHEDPRGVVGLPRVRGPRDSPGDLPPLRRLARAPRRRHPPARRREEGTPAAPAVRDATRKTKKRPTSTPPAGRTPSRARSVRSARRSVRREPAVAFAARAAPIRHQTVVGVCRRRRASRDDARRRSTRTRTRIRNVRRFRRGRVPRRAFVRVRVGRRERVRDVSDGASPRLDRGARRAVGFFGAGFGVLP